MCAKVVKITGMDRAGNVTVVRDDGKSHTVGAEGWCSIARYYGWKACSRCDETDGSVPCAHRNVPAMLLSAGEFIAANVGESTDDPGWWE